MCKLSVMDSAKIMSALTLVWRNHPVWCRRTARVPRKRSFSVICLGVQGQHAKEWSQNLISGGWNLLFSTFFSNVKDLFTCVKKFSFGSICHGVGGYDISCQDSYCGRLKKKSSKRQVDIFIEKKCLCCKVTGNNLIYLTCSLFYNPFYVIKMFNCLNFRTRHCLKPRGRRGAFCSERFPCKTGYECRDDLKRLWDGKKCQKTSESKYDY